MSIEKKEIPEEKTDRMGMTEPELFVQEKETLPLIPLRGMSVFPGMVVHFDVGREKSVKALEAAMERDQMAFLVTQKEVIKEDINPDDFYSIGCRVKVKQ